MGCDIACIFGELKNDSKSEERLDFFLIQRYDSAYQCCQDELFLDGRNNGLAVGPMTAAAVVATVGEAAKETEAAKGLMKLEGI